jgi:hypothetical protein
MRTSSHNACPVFQIAQLPSCKHNTAQHVVNTGFASVPFTVDGAPETMENPKETPKPEEVFRMLVDHIREVHYTVLKQKEWFGSFNWLRTGLARWSRESP